jgi:hypothetical protein
VPTGFSSALPAPVRCCSGARHEVVLPLLAPIVVVTVVAAALYGLMRFRAPAEVSIVALAAVGIDRLVPVRRRLDALS